MSVNVFHCINALKLWMFGNGSVQILGSPFIDNVHPTIGSDPFVPVLLELARTIKAPKKMLRNFFSTGAD